MLLISFAEGCPNLKELDISRCDLVTDELITHLADNCSNLRCIDLTAFRVKVQHGREHDAKRIKLGAFDYAEAKSDNEGDLLSVIANAQRMNDSAGVEDESWA